MKRIFTRNTLFSLLGIFFISLSFFAPFVPVAQAENQPAMDVAFPPKAIYGDLAEYAEKGYLTDAFDLKLKEAGDTWATFDFKVDVTKAKFFHGSSTQGQWVDDGSTPGVLDSTDTYGTLNTVYDENLLSAGSDASLGKEGFALEMTTSVNPSIATGAPYQQEYPSAAVPLVRTGRIAYFTNPVRTNLNSTVLIPQIINQPLLWFEIKVPNLKASTQYVVRLSGMEDTGSNPGAAYSQSITFTTTPDGTTTTTNETVIDQTNAGTFSDLSSNLGDTDPIMDGIRCSLEHPLSSLTGLGDGGTFTGCVVEMVHWIYGITAWVLRGTGWIFDAFASLSLSSYMYSHASFITEGWKTVRDIVNIFFIFALLYAAIRIITSGKGYSVGSIAPLIRNVIVAAILINFSLFIVKLGIDASNISARVFYNAIAVTVQGVPGDPITNQDKTGIHEVGLSQGIVAGFNIQGATSSVRLQEVKANANGATVKPDPSLLVGILLVFGILINLTAAGVFFTVGVLFMGRILGFYMAMIFAPFAFMSELIPALGSIKGIGMGSWKSNFTKDMLMGPIFLFFIWIIMALAKGDFLRGLIGDVNSTHDFTKALIMISIEAMVILGLLREAKSLAQGYASDFGKELNAFVSKGLNWAVGTDIGYTAGAIGVVAQATLGKYGASVANNDELKKEANKGGLSGAWARLKLGAGKELATNSFDFSKTKAVDGALGIAGVNLTKDIQEGRDQLKTTGEILSGAGSLFTDRHLDFDLTGGYEKATERGQKYREDLANSFLVKGLEGEDRDKKAKAWREQADKDLASAKDIAEKAGAVFNKEAFKNNYEAGIATRYKDAKTKKLISVDGREKVLSTKEENNRRLNERANRTELNRKYIDEKQDVLAEYDKYMEMQTKARAAKPTAFLNSAGEFDIDKFNETYAKRGTLQTTLTKSVTDKGIFNEDKFKNEFLSQKDKTYVKQRNFAKVTGDSRFIGADGKFNEIWFRQAYVADKLNTAQNLAVSSMRKKAFEETKKDKELSKKETDRIKSKLDTATKELDKLTSKIEAAKTTHGVTDEEEAIEKEREAIDQLIANLQAEVVEATQKKDTARLSSALFKKSQEEKKKKSYESILKNRNEAQQKVDDNNTKLGE